MRILTLAAMIALAAPLSVHAKSKNVITPVSKVDDNTYLLGPLIIHTENCQFQTSSDSGAMIPTIAAQRFLVFHSLTVFGKWQNAGQSCRIQRIEGGPS